MGDFEIILSFVVFLAFFLGALYALFYVLKNIIQYQYWKHFRPLPEDSKTILNQYVSYYKNLSIKQKRQFERRVALFERSKYFIGKNGLQVTEEMQILISATAVQLTFGFKYFQLPRFQTIYIYPDIYIDRVTKRKHKGGVNPRAKSISLSWNHFLDGFKNPHDGINLGYHEMTHALSLENRYTGNYAHSFINANVYQHWKDSAKLEMQKIKTSDNPFFRKYASVNLEEFLAVTVEVFFEKPNEFKAYHPSLFHLTCKLLNQFPV